MKALRAELAAARQESARKDRMIAMLAHDLRAPLSTLLLWESVLRSHSDEKTRARALDAIQRSAQTQAALVQHLVDFVRVLGRTRPLETRPAQIADLIATAIERRGALVAAKNLLLERQIANRLGSVSGDPDCLHQILSCMLTNVVEYATTDHHLVVAARGRGDKVMIEVTASPRGSVIEASTHDEQRIGGLDLELARELTELLGGSLVALRAPDGDGFGIRLSMRRFRTIPDSPHGNDETMDGHAQRDRASEQAGRPRRQTPRSRSML